jgi:hypothetical protein
MGKNPHQPSSRARRAGKQQGTGPAEPPKSRRAAGTWSAEQQESDRTERTEQASSRDRWTEQEAKQQPTAKQQESDGRRNGWSWRAAGRLDAVLVAWTPGACVRYSAGAGRLGAEHRSRHGRTIALAARAPEQPPEQPPQKEARVTALRTNGEWTSQTFEELRHCTMLRHLRH